MTLGEILAKDFIDKNVVIIGLPASGKTYLSNKISKNHLLIHTDDYKHYGFEQSMYIALDHVRNITGHSVCEGVQCYRMLRKSLEINYHWPDVIIECQRDTANREQTYREERNPNKLKYVRRFNDSLTSIYNQYLAEVDIKPEILVWNNNY